MTEAATPQRYEFKECTVTTVARVSATIPAGRHTAIAFFEGFGGICIRAMPRAIDISKAEWARIRKAGLVSD